MTEGSIIDFSQKSRSEGQVSMSESPKYKLRILITKIPCSVPWIIFYHSNKYNNNLLLLTLSDITWYPVLVYKRVNINFIACTKRSHLPDGKTREWKTLKNCYAVSVAMCCKMFACSALLPFPHLTQEMFVHFTQNLRQALFLTLANSSMEMYDLTSLH